MEKSSKRRLGQVAAIGGMLAAAFCAGLAQPWQIGLAGHDGGSQSGQGNQIGTGNVGSRTDHATSTVRDNGPGPRNAGGPQQNGPGVQQNGRGAQQNGSGSQYNGPVSRDSGGTRNAGPGTQNNGSISTGNHSAQHTQQNNSTGQQNNGGTVNNYPTPALTGGEAQIESVTPADGGSTMGPAALITLRVTKFPNNGNTLFVACDLLNRSSRGHLWFTKQEILVAGRQSITVAAPAELARDPALIGTVRLCTVITADQGAAATLRFLMRMDVAGIKRDPVTGHEYDLDRAELPAGAAPISNQVLITVERIFGPTPTPPPGPTPTPTH